VPAAAGAFERRYCQGLSSAWFATASVQCLTPHSSGAPTAGRQARAAPWFILHRAGLASYRRRPLSSNVRRHKRPNLPFTHWEFQPCLLVQYHQPTVEIKFVE
jgi:hypothetical protein